MNERAEYRTNYVYDREPLFSVYFNQCEYYEFVIDTESPIVYSECCSDRMTLDVACKVRDALSAWIEGTQ